MGASEPDDDRQSFLAERRGFQAAEEEAAKSFDRAMLTLAGGALALSIAYIQQVAPDPRRWTIWWFLLPGWIAFCLCLLSTLASLLAAQYSAREGGHSLDQSHNADFTVEVEVRRRHDIWVRLRHYLPRWMSGATRSWGEAVDRLNLLSAALFVSGVVFLVLFSIANLLAKESSMGERETKAQSPGEQRGYRGPTPAPPPPPKNDPPPPRSDKK